MGVVADAALESGGSVHGVITESLHHRGQSHSGLTRHEIALTLRSRKERMVELADAFIALPGGIGTIEELMEVWTMNQLSEIDKPVGLLNTAGFFTAFLGSSTIWSTRNSCRPRIGTRYPWMQTRVP